MMIRFGSWIVLLCVATLVTGCDSEESTTVVGKSGPATTRSADIDPELAAQAAQETVKQMLALAKEYAWNDLIRNFYGEIDKVENDQQMARLQNSFEHSLGRELRPVLEKAAEITPVIEDGKALFQVDGETIYELHLGDDGRWGFHL